MPENPEIHTEGAVLCSHVASGEREILLALREDDGVLQLFCGEWDHDDADAARIACAHCLVERDPSLQEVVAMEPGMVAERGSAKHGWVMEEFIDEDEE